MPRWFDGNLDWSIFALVVPMGGAAMLFLSLLAFLWEFDLSTSPVWQVGVYHLALALPVFMTFVVASRRPFSFSGGFRRFTMGAAVLVPVALFGGSWALNGPFDGFRGRAHLHLGDRFRGLLHVGLDGRHLPVHGLGVRKSPLEMPA